MRPRPLHAHPRRRRQSTEDFEFIDLRFRRADAATAHGRREVSTAPYSFAAASPRRQQIGSSASHRV